MGVSKVTIKTENGEETIMDTTGTTVTPQTLARGATAVNAAGDEIEGEMPIENVLYVKQSLSNEQKNQARENIGAASLAVQSSEPSDGDIWIDPDGEGDEIILAEIDDDVINPEKTWSSSKINREMSGLNEKIVQEVNDREKAITDLKAQGVQQVPLFANSVEEMTDTSKVYVMSDENEKLYIWVYKKTTVTMHPNMFDASKATLNVRLNTSAADSSNKGTFATDFIPVDFSGADTFIMRISPYLATQTNQRIHYFNANKEVVGDVYMPPQAEVGFGEVVGDVYTTDLMRPTLAKNNKNVIKYIRLTLSGTGSDTVSVTRSDIEDVAITFDNVTTSSESYAWVNSGREFVPADYEDRIIDLEESNNDHEVRLKILEVNVDNETEVPEYWLEELDTKSNLIQQAMEKAGRNKSAFLWYTDAHWVNGNSKISPILLKYLYMNTPMSKVNFGGDIIGDTLLATREEMKYLYEWRKAIRGLPNHHSVLGNHDSFDLSSVDYEDDNYRYAFLLAPEETSDIVWGDGNYYYIDNPSEKTRYLYIAYLVTNHEDMTAQAGFFIDAIKSVKEGWHIVAISHRWFQYESTSTPTVGHITAFESEMLGMFDAYNARTTKAGYNYCSSQDFSDAKGKVEFCIGGHIHYDYDFFTDGGIPIIITTADANQNRVPDSTIDSGTVGTITESAVFGIVADYNNNKVVVVGVGRGTSREVNLS